MLRTRSVRAPTTNQLRDKIEDVLAVDNWLWFRGVGSVWLFHRGKPYGRFATVQMFDDGAHGDEYPHDNIFGAATTNYPAGTDADADVWAIMNPTPGQANQ